MRRPWPIVALAVIVAVNLAILSGVWRARRGSPDALVRLDERELRLVTEEADSTMRALELVLHAVTWTEPRAIADLGFSVLPAVSPHDASVLRGALPRPVVLVCEFDGPAARERRDEWRARLALAGPGFSRGTGSGEAGPPLVERASRLVAVDAGLDAEVLRVRYPERSRHVLLPAVVGLQVPVAPARAREGPPAVRLIRVLPERVLVPTAWRGVLAGLPASRIETIPPAAQTSPGGTAETPEPLRVLAHDPRYEVTLAIDSSLQPYIVDIRRLH